MSTRKYASFMSRDVTHVSLSRDGILDASMTVEFQLVKKHTELSQVENGSPPLSFLGNQELLCF